MGTLQMMLTTFTKKNLVSKTNTKKIISKIIGDNYSFNKNSRVSKIRSKCCGAYYVKHDGGEWVCPNCNTPR
jgi:hypothetical protein